MSMSDPIADMLSRIRNGQRARLISVICPFSKIKESILKVLTEEGYINGYSIQKGESFDNLEIELKYLNTGRAVINEIARVSKPGKRVTSSIGDLPSHYNGLGIYILTTSKGIVSDREARALGVGGEVICKVF